MSSTETFETLSVSPRRAADMLGCGRTRVYELLQLGELVSYRDGAARRILTSSIHAYVQRQVEQQATSPRWLSTADATKASIEKRRIKSR